MKRQLCLGKYGRKLPRGLLGVLSGAGGGMEIGRGGGRGWLGVSERPKVVSGSQHVVREKGMGLCSTLRLMPVNSHLDPIKGRYSDRERWVNCG